MFSTTDERLHGVLAVMLTPFTPDRQIDAARLQREVDWAFAAGAWRSALKWGSPADLMKGYC
jgi:hypothetical protein